jgi:hypothetical protein
VAASSRRLHEGLQLPRRRARLADKPNMSNVDSSSWRMSGRLTNRPRHMSNADAAAAAAGSPRATRMTPLVLCGALHRPAPTGPLQLHRRRGATWPAFSSLLSQA